MPDFETFNAAVVAVLDRLCEVFPRRLTLYMDDLLPDGSAEQKELYWDSIEFLYGEGIVRHKGATRGLYFDEIGLTAKGLEILDSPLPDSLSVRRTKRELVADAVKSGSK